MMRPFKFMVSLLPALILSACGTSSSVSLLGQINFAPPSADKPEPLYKSPLEVSGILAKGGYIIYMRHGRTEYDKIELERATRSDGRFDLNRCETQRPLSDQGRAELRIAGEKFRQAGIPIDRSYSSRYCRAIESARFFVDDAQATDMLSGEGDVGKDPAQKARTLNFLSMRPAPGKNHFMMAHGGIFWEATGFTVQEAHAVVLDPANLRVIVARIAPEGWAALNVSP